MPKKSTTRRAKQALRAGKRPSTAAGEFVGEEVHRQKPRRGAARSRKQAIAIGLSKARRAGVRIPAKPGASKKVKRSTPRVRRKTARAGAPRTRRARSAAPRRKSARKGR